MLPGIAILSGIAMLTEVASTTKPPVPILNQPAVASNTSEWGYLLHVTDIHADLDYAPGSPTKCVLGTTGLGCCRRYDIPLPGHQPASSWGERTCDTPVKLVNETLRWISQNLPTNPTDGLDAVLYGGDSVGHHDISQGYQRNVQTANLVTSMFQQYFPSCPVLPNQGNHDTYPIDQVLPGVGTDFRGHLADNWESSIGSSAAALFHQRGYYSYPLNSNVTVVSMSSILYDSHNLFKISPHPQDPQVQWLSNLVNEARQHGTHLILLGHIFPTAGESTTEFTRWLGGVLQNNSDVIKSSVFGHSHNDEWVVIPPDVTMKRQPTACLVTPSLMPDARNPSFRLYQYHRPTGQIIDYYQYYVDLATTLASDRIQITLDYQFSVEYPHFNVSGDSLWQLAETMSRDSNTSTKYCSHYWGTGNTTGNCDVSTVTNLLANQIVSLKV